MSDHNYIERIASITRAGHLEPFVISWTEPYAMEASSEVIRDVRHDGIKAGENLQDLLDRLLPTIERYPYDWPLSGRRIDPEGYDLMVNWRTGELDMPPVAYKEALRLLGVPPAEAVIENPYRGGKRVFAPHLTKLQLTLEKASPLSTLSFQFFSKHPVDLLSLVAERDLAGSTLPQEINLDLVQAQQHDDTITLLFGQPIFAKRLTFVLGQNAASANAYTVKRTGEDFSYAPADGDAERLSAFSSRYHHKETYITNELLTDSQIKDWSAERREAYIKWRNTVQKKGG